MTSAVELSLSGCRRQPCGGDPVVDVVFDGAQGGAELWWGLGLAGGEQGAQDAVADFGVEDRELQAVGGQVVGVGVQPAGSAEQAEPSTSAVRGGASLDA
jgi:hypothetical protein